MLKLEKIKPIGKRKCPAHMSFGRNHHLWGEIEVDTFPINEDAKAFKEFRREMGISLGVGAERMGLSAAELSGLESGEYVCDWELAVDLISTCTVSSLESAR